MSPYISPKYQILTPAQALNSIYIDFEGEGEKAGKSTPIPHMLGAYWPKQNGEKARYQAYLFREDWKPVANGSGGRAQLATLEDTLRSLIDQANARGGKLVFFSGHEAKMIKQFCPSLYDEFCKVAFNLNPPLKRLFNRHHHYGEGKRPDQLDLYAQFYFPQIRLNELPEGAAETCRRLDTAAGKSQRWRSWSNKDQQRARDLLDYNFCDCRVTWKLAKKLANAYANKNMEQEAA